MARNRFLHHTWAIGGIALVAMTATACGSTAKSTTSSIPPSTPAVTATSSADSTPGTVAQALAALPATSWGDRFITFGQSAAMTAADNASSVTQTTFGSIVELTDPLVAAPDSQIEAQQTALLGFDPQKAAYAVTMGAAPQNATVFYGTFPVSSIETKLTTAGYTRHSATDGQTIWTYRTPGTDPTLYPEDDDIFMPYAIEVTASRITVGYTTTDVENITSGSSMTLAATSDLDALATCLGSPTAGMIAVLYQTPQPAHMLTAGIGITSTTGNANVELCVEAPDAPTAQAMQASWASQIRTGHDPDSGLPMAKMLTNPQATITTQAQHVVRFTATMAPGVSAQIFLDRYLGGDLATLIIPPTGTTA